MHFEHIITILSKPENASGFSTWKYHFSTFIPGEPCVQPSQKSDKNARNLYRKFQKYNFSKVQ